MATTLSINARYTDTIGNRVTETIEKVVVIGSRAIVTVRATCKDGLFVTNREFTTRIPVINIKK